MERKKITLPLTRELARTLHAGDQVLLTGTIYTSRDAGHKRMCEALAKGEKIPFDPTDATIYYVGPTPAKPGAVIGSAGINVQQFLIRSAELFERFQQGLIDHRKQDQKADDDRADVTGKPVQDQHDIRDVGHAAHQQ